MGGRSAQPGQPLVHRCGSSEEVDEGSEVRAGSEALKRYVKPKDLEVDRRNTEERY